MARRVQKFTDGFWRVEGLPEDSYYASEATAKRVASGLDKADAERERGPSQPRPAPPEKK
jgi:hypothetical protein